MYIYTYKHIYIYTYKHIYTYIYIYLIYIYIYKHTYTYIYIYLMYVYTRLCAPQVLNFSERIPRDLLFIIRTQNLVRALCSDLVSLSLSLSFSLSLSRSLSLALSRARALALTLARAHTHTLPRWRALLRAREITRAYLHTCMYD